MDLLTGARAVLSGFDRIVREPKLKKLLVLPMLITALLYAALIAGLLYSAPQLLALIWTEPEGGALRLLWIALVVLVFGLLLMVLGLLFVNVSSLVASPFYERMVLVVLDARGVKARDPRFIEGAINDLAFAVLFMLPAGVAAVLAFIPLIGPAFAAIAAILSGLGLAVSAISPSLLALDYPLGERIRFVRTHLGLLAGLGGMLALALLVPLLILIALPSAMVGAAAIIEPRTGAR